MSAATKAKYLRRRTRGPASSGPASQIASSIGGKRTASAWSSGRGLYHYASKNRAETCTNFSKSMSIGGTLVLWQIPAEAVAA